MSSPLATVVVGEMGAVVAGADAAGAAVGNCRAVGVGSTSVGAGVATGAQPATSIANRIAKYKGKVGFDCIIWTSYS